MALLSLHYALKYPDKVNKLIFLNPGIFDPQCLIKGPLTRGRRLVKTLRVVKPQIRWVVKKGKIRQIPFIPSAIKENISLIKTPDSDVDTFIDTLINVCEYPFSKNLEQLKSDYLFIFGTKDIIYENLRSDYLKKIAPYTKLVEGRHTIGTLDTGKLLDYFSDFLV